MEAQYYERHSVENVVDLLLSDRYDEVLTILEELRNGTNEEDNLVSHF